MQSAMAHAVAEIERATGDRIDLDDGQQVPLDDVFAFKLIQESQTIGMFQLESPGNGLPTTHLLPANPHFNALRASFERDPDQFVTTR